MPEPGYKCCGDCGEEKPRDRFSRKRVAKDGLQSRCKDCEYERGREWRERNPERRAAAAKRYRQRHPEKVRELSKRGRERHPEKHRARVAVANAVAYGSLDKPDACEGCGERVAAARELHGHHEDYSKPRDVEWLCDPCHKAKHA